MCQFRDGGDAPKSYRWRLLAALGAACLGFGSLLTWNQTSPAAEGKAPTSCRCFALELYTRGHDPASLDAARALETFEKEHRGVRVRAAR